MDSETRGAEDMTRTIRKNTHEARAVLADATTCKVYRLSNDFVGQDVEPKYAMQALYGLDFAKLTEREGIYCVRVHDNLWYELS